MLGSSWLCVCVCNFQQDNAPCLKAKVIPNWFCGHVSEFSELQWPPQSPDLHPVEQLLDLEEQEIGSLNFSLTKSAEIT